MVDAPGLSNFVTLYIVHDDGSILKPVLGFIDRNGFDG